MCSISKLAQRSTRGLMILLAAGLALTGCAHDVKVSYPTAPPGYPTGSVTVRLTNPSSNLAVTVNGVLVAEGKHSKKVTVTGVPAGPAEVAVAAGGGGMSRVEKSVTIEVEPYRDTALVVAAPELGTGTAIYMGMYQLGSWIFASAVWVAILL